MTQPLILSAGKPEHPAMDYDFLLGEGLHLIEHLGGTAWTDFNPHDPGITILEQVCYAITDLAYRTGYDMKDILASGDEKDPYRYLFTPSQVLATDPVTLSDMRKLLLDIPGVRNAWIEPAGTGEQAMVYDPSDNTLHLRTSKETTDSREQLELKGLYNVLVESEKSTDDTPAIINAVKIKLNACRPLAVDVASVRVLPKQAITVTAEIEIDIIDSPERLRAGIFFLLGKSISPAIRFYSLTEMLTRGKTMDEIMDGPFLEHGFIDDGELENMTRKKGIRTSDLIREIMSVDGVTAVRSICVSGNDWYLPLDPDKTPELNIKPDDFTFFRSGIPVTVNPEKVHNIQDERDRTVEARPLEPSERDVPLAGGIHRNIHHYRSIQNQFPALYGLGPYGLSDTESPARKAQVRHLSAYLMFFDQLLADGFAQLGHVRDLFGFDGENKTTYFSGFPVDPWLSRNDLFNGKPDDGGQDLDAVNTDRKNRFLTHLLARFAEEFTAPAHKDENGLIRDKGLYLSDYPRLGTARGSGFNYFAQPWTGNGSGFSGLELRISRKLGIPAWRHPDNVDHPELADNGFVMIEHILLRPGLADAKSWKKAQPETGWPCTAFIDAPVERDPYSSRVSFVFPVSAEKDKEKIRKTLREETPAHLYVRCFFLDQEALHTFQEAYRVWMENIREGVDVDPDNPSACVDHFKMRNARDTMILLLGLGTPYPLRDLGIIYPARVAFGETARIEIPLAQDGVTYQLCDEHGNPVQCEAVTGEGGKGAVITTPPIAKDITWTLRAIRKKLGADNNTVETLLNRLVTLKVGIDTGLAGEVRETSPEKAGDAADTAPDATPESPGAGSPENPEEA